eukprot:SAG31_NODE_3317_length_4424_cov_3.662197_2_plen_94_part_00
MGDMFRRIVVVHKLSLSDAVMLQVNWEYDECLVTADRMAFSKYMTKALAEQHGLVATFMPKPFVDRAGNGCHAHITLHNGEQSQEELRYLSRL